MSLSKAKEPTADRQTKLLGVRIEKELHQAVRRQAFDEDRPLSELVRDALGDYLERAKTKKVPA